MAPHRSIPRLALLLGLAIAAAPSESFSPNQITFRNKLVGHESGAIWRHQQHPLLPKSQPPQKRHGSWPFQATRSVDESRSTAALPFESPASSNVAHYDAVICGGGPAGLLTAIMLAQKYGPSYKIAVCEQRAATPPSPSDETVWSHVARFYLLGIGHRGQTALRRFGVFDDFCQASVEIQGRRDWQPGMTKVEDGRIIPANREVSTRVLARDKLVGMLHAHLVENYIDTGKASVDLLYGYQVRPLDFATEEDRVSIQITKCEDVAAAEEEPSYKGSQDSEQLCNVDEVATVTADLLIGADGVARSVAQAMEEADKERYSQMNLVHWLFAKKPFQITKFHDDNPRVYKSVPIRIPSDWPYDYNYSARSSDSRVTLEALPSDHKGNLCALLLIKPDDELAQPHTDPVQLRKFFDKEFPQFGALIDDEEMARVAQKSASRLPSFRFASRLNMGRRTLVLGDAAHTVKPHYGLGANTALEDVQILSDILDETEGVPEAVETFSKRRSGDAAALVTMSRNMDRPGKLFFVCFLIPLILDGIFHKVAPAMFGPNMFQMFQKRGVGFQQIQRKKRLDRVLQVTILASMATGFGVAVKTGIRMLARALGQSQRTVSLGLVVVGVMVAACRKALDSTRSKETRVESLRGDRRES